jgi:CheY-like chemotaxis protein
MKDGRGRLAGTENQHGTLVTQIRNVLIIEDEEILAENLQTHLRRCGWNARIAGTGTSAVTAAREFCPDLILLDYHLPDMNGFQVLDTIGAAHHCGCVLMTGHPTDTVLADAKRHGISHILSKPFALAGLQSLLMSAAAEFRSNHIEKARRPSWFDPGGFAQSPSLLGNFSSPA